MTRIEHTSAFHADAEQTFRLLTDEAFLSAYAQELGATRHFASVDTRDRETVARLDWTVPTEGVPDFLKRIVGHEISMVQVLTWSTSGHGGRPEHELEGELLLDVRASREGHLKGSVRLIPDLDGSRLVVSGNIRVSLPVGRGKVEGMACDLIEAALDDQAALGNRWLEDGYPKPVPAGSGLA